VCCLCLSVPNYGATTVDLFAPGVGITWTVRRRSRVRGSWWRLIYVGRAGVLC
jgi:hypothetical protein